jgi:hypothetical protein
MSQQGPDFLCVGMQKAGTGWLYQAFDEIEGFRMLPIKEFHHFDRLGQIEKNVMYRRKKNILRQMASRRGGLSPISRFRLKKAVKNYIHSEFSTPTYLDLFEPNRKWLTGDVTPSYSTLEPAAVVRVHDVLPDRPVILSFRHPVDRFWSSFNMHLRRQFNIGTTKTTGNLQKYMDEEATIEKLGNFLSEPMTLARSMPSASYDAWSIYGENLIVVSLEQIISQPKALMEKLAAHILGREVVLPDSFKVKNGKAEREKVTITDQHRALLFDAFGDEIQTCKQRFPDIAANWKTS